MLSLKAQDASKTEIGRIDGAEVAHLVLYDGDCGLCNGLTRFVLERDRRGLFNFASLQSTAAKKALQSFGRLTDELNTMYVLVNYRGEAPTLLARARAGLFVISRLGWPWRAARLLSVLPNSVLDRIYDVIAGHRYLVFGKHEQCLLPRPAFRSRFIDSEIDA